MTEKDKTSLNLPDNHPLNDEVIDMDEETAEDMEDVDDDDVVDNSDSDVVDDDL